MRFRKVSPQAQIIEVFQSKRPKPPQQPNLIFKMRVPNSSQLAYVNYDMAARNYPQTLIDYLTPHIIKKPIEQSIEPKLTPMFDCDYKTDSDFVQPIHVYFKLQTKVIQNNTARNSKSKKQPSKTTKRTPSKTPNKTPKRTPNKTPKKTPNKSPLKPSQPCIKPLTKSTPRTRKQHKK